MSVSVQTRFGKAIRQIRIGKQISQEEFADMCGMHRSYMSDVELGKRNVSLENIEKIATSLEMPISRIFQISEDLEL